MLRSPSGHARSWVAALSCPGRSAARSGALQTRDRSSLWRSRISGAPPHFVTRCTASGTRDSVRRVRNLIHFSNSPARSRGAFLRPGFAFWLRATPIEGWRSAERRTDACEASVGPALSGQARHLARRLASPYGGRPPPGARTVAIFGSGAALPLTGIAAGSVTANSSHPGRSARRRGPCLPGRRLRIAAAGRHASLRPQDRL